MFGMYIPARSSGKTKALAEEIKKTLKGRNTMKTIKRNLMGGYVEFSDGTFGKPVEMDRLVQLAREGLDAYLTVTEDDTIYMDVHEDEASAYEPNLFFDDEDDYEMRVSHAMNEFYDMYSNTPHSPLMLTSRIAHADEILDRIWGLDHELYADSLRSLREDMTTDMKTILSTMDIMNNDAAKHIFNMYLSVWQNLNFMEDE